MSGLLPLKDVKIVVCIRRFKTLAEIKEFFDWMIPHRFHYSNKIRMEDRPVWNTWFLPVHDFKTTSLFGFDNYTTFIAFKLRYADHILSVYDGTENG